MPGVDPNALNTSDFTGTTSEICSSANWDPHRDSRLVFRVVLNAVGLLRLVQTMYYTSYFVLETVEREKNIEDRKLMVFRPGKMPSKRSYLVTKMN